MNIPQVEILESRIAPAVFLVSPVSLAVKDSVSLATAMDAGAETTANTAAGSDVAFKMSAGDTLVYDMNQNNKADGGETVLVKLVAGKAMVFMTDLDGDGVFDLNDITGLAIGTTASEAFSATINTDINGDIISALDGADAVITTGTLTLQDVSINGLTITGAVFGDIAVGGSITNLTVGKSIYGLQNTPSVSKIVTGTAAGVGRYQFDGRGAATGPTLNAYT